MILAGLATSWLKKLLPPLLIMAAVAGYSAGAYYMGYQHKGKVEQAKEVKALKGELAKIAMRWTDDRHQIDQLQARLSSDVKKTRTITQEVPVYVTPDKDEFCGPPVGIVGLLNAARQPELPFAAALVDDPGRAASGVSYTEQVQDTLAITQRYNALMVRHNELIKWIEETYGPSERPGLRRSLE